MDNLTIEIVKKYYEKGYLQGKLDARDGIYIENSQLCAAFEEDLTREMHNVSLSAAGDS